MLSVCFQEVESIESVLSGVMHTGNIAFTEHEQEHQTQIQVQDKTQLGIGKDQQLICEL